MEVIDKSALSDTFISLRPKNTSGGISKQQIAEIQIPKSQYVLNLRKSYISVELVINVKTDKKVSSNNDYIGFLNSACIFDQVSLSNGRNLFTDTFSQINSRIWQLSKSDAFLQANSASFINYDEPNLNSHFILIPVKELETNYKEFRMRMKIPLPCLFNCFDNCEFFSTTQLNESINLSMQLSNFEKFMAYVEVEDGKVKNINEFGTNDEYKSDGFNISLNSDESHYFINEITLHCPCHIPDQIERENLDKLIENGLWYSTFRNCDIQSRSIESSSGEMSVAANFSTNSANIYGIFTLFSKNNNCSIFNKPLIKLFTQYLSD